jgi:hypothetical protein
MSDYAEFIAGTDPTNPASKLYFFAPKALTNHLVELQWTAVPGRLYQLLSCSGLTQSPTLPRPSLSGSIQTPGGSFKLHINAQSNWAYAIEISSNLTSWTSLYTNKSGGVMDYSDSATPRPTRRFYRTLVLPISSTNSWTPVSDWLQASGSPMTFIVTNTAVGSQFYRVQVRP